jgi:hypothetical protein
MDFAIGDVNGDGADDILIGAPGADSPNSTASLPDSEGGGAFLFYGGSYRNTNSTILHDSADSTFWGDQPNQMLGKTVGLGDMDGDGNDDIFLVKIWDYADISTIDWFLWSFGTCYYWYGSSSISGTHYVNGSGMDWDGRITNKVQKAIWIGYLDEYWLGMFANGNIECGDMDGDGREEIAFGTPYEWYTPYWESEDYWAAGGVWVFHPGSNIKTGSRIHIIANDTSYGNWQHYHPPFDSYSEYHLGYPISMFDYNEDDLQDLIIGAPEYSGGMIYLVKGRSSYTTGDLKITDMSVYDVAISTGGGGSHAFGDYDGDTKPDLAVSGSDKVYILENSVFNLQGSGQNVTASSSSMFTIEAPSESGDFAEPGEPYADGVYEVTKVIDTATSPIVFWNRDDYEICEDVFISDPWISKVYGVAKYDMFGIGTFEAEPADGPDGNLFFA